jgi:outer membrane protein assembly factor BamB
MKRWGAVVLVSLVACAPGPRSEKPNRAASLELPAAPDRRPEVGRGETPGDDLTELVRLQNAPGSEPSGVFNRGQVYPASVRPEVQHRSDGFVARLPGASRVPTPAYHRGRVFAGGHGTHELHAIEASTGKPAWSLRLSDDGPTAPACKDGVCVFNTYSCTIFGVAANTGKHLWSWWLGSPQLATPVVAGEVVYTSYPNGAGPDGAKFVLAAFDLKTGTPRWRRWIDAEVNAAPVAFGGHVFVATGMGTLYQFGADDGAVVSVLANRIASPPTVTPEGLAFGQGERARDNDMLATAHPVFPALEQMAIARDPVAPRPRPLVADHRLIEVEDGLVTATNRRSGRRLWQRRLEGHEAQTSEPLVWAGRSVLLATTGGNVLRIEPDTGELVATFALGAETTSQPIVHDGWLYAGTVDGAVIAHDTGAPELTGWEMLGGGPDRSGMPAPEGT